MGRDRPRSGQGGELALKRRPPSLAHTSPPVSASPRHPPHEGGGKAPYPAFAGAGGQRGDRIEHASVASDALVAEIALLNLTVVTQPNFVSERGDGYLASIPREDWPYLYRLRAFRQAGVTLAGGTDAPFGAADPWAAMAAAISRRTAGGRPLSPQEALSPEEALNLFLADPHDLSRVRHIEVGVVADLCLLAQDWAALREDIGSAAVRATLIGGQLVHPADPVVMAR